jgi:hypothetical protein
MAVARSVLRALLADELQEGSATELTTTSGGSTSTLIDTGLKLLAGGSDDDFCLGKYILVTGAGSSNDLRGESSRVTAYVASTTTITVAPVFSAVAESSVTYEILDYDPVDLHNALNRSCELLYPFIAVPKRDETLNVDSWITTNGSFETGVSGGDFSGWTKVGTPTLADNTAYMHGSNSASVTASGAEEGIGQTPTFNVKERSGLSYRFRMWVKATAANKGRIQLRWGTSNTSSDYHGGVDEWELLEVTGTPPNGFSAITAACMVADGAAVLFDGGPGTGLSIDSHCIYRYTIPSAILKGPYILSVQANHELPEGTFHTINYWHLEEEGQTRYIVLDRLLTPLMGLRIEGYGALSTMSSDTATTEVNTVQQHLLVARAAQWMMDHQASTSATTEFDLYERRGRYFQSRVEELKRQPGMGTVQRAATSTPRLIRG